MSEISGINKFRTGLRYTKRHITLSSEKGDSGDHTCTEVDQNNGNTTDTVHIPLLVWCWATFCLQYSHRPWNGLVQVLNSL
jgi:hypothetical protein